MRSTEPKLKNSETIERVLRWLAPTKIVTFVWEQGEPPECGRHLRCRIRLLVPISIRPEHNLRSPEGAPG